MNINKDNKRNTRKLFNRGFSIRNLQSAIAVITLLVSVLLLISTFRAYSGYKDMQKQLEDYEDWQHSAYDLQTASDYLTEQARCFAQTGKREYLDNYFKESKITKRRDKTMDNLESILGGTKAYKALETSMAESVDLMKREYYSMRLTCDAYGYDIADFPEEIQNVKLSAGDKALSDSEKDDLARDMVFDDEYHKKKDMIYENMQLCLSDLKHDVKVREKEAKSKFSSLMNRQRILIITAIIFNLAAMLFVLFLVISPLLRAVVYIRADQPVPVRGSNEMRFLARNYNLMYESNKEENEQLAFEATHDKLTGIYNRSGYDFFIKNVEWKTSALLLFDVDKFKNINDTLGHETGDKVLVYIADILKNTFRNQDYICRIGGDEFAVIMVHTKKRAVDRIVSNVEKINLQTMNPENDLPDIHISCGAVFGDEDKPYEELFREADAALYKAKKKGGCCCEIA